MKCDECVKAGMKSRVYDLGSMQTLMGYEAFYDEEGRYHVHDPNITTTGYRCSNGHKWNTKKIGACRWCDPKKEVS